MTKRSTKAADEAEEDDDPIVAEYDVYITPELQQQLLLLQHMTRPKSQPFAESTNQKPTELRIKSKTGLVEIDIPIDPTINYDKEKGVKWGEALRKGNMVTEGGSYGFAGGFNVGGGATTGAGKGKGKQRARDTDPQEESSSSREISHDAMIENWDDTVKNGRALQTMTHGGRIIPPNDTQPHYMVGAFRGNQLHLTKIDALVQMRPQLHHLDALVEMDKASSRTQREPTESKSGEARPVQMTAKSVDGEDLDMTETTKTLRAMHEEKWKRHKYHDEDSPESWDLYYNKLFHPDPENAPKLQSTMTKAEFLDAFSCPLAGHGESSKPPAMDSKMKRGEETSSGEEEVIGVVDIEDSEE